MYVVHFVVYNEIDDTIEYR